ncbi:MAG: hypothetical protein KY395_08605 [Actinobacteria bacterium]|nr:hypothetical protein [Actinomycetota bacterium]
MNAPLLAVAVIVLLLHMVIALTLTDAFLSTISAGAALGAWPVVWLVPLVGLLALVPGSGPISGPEAAAGRACRACEARSSDPNSGGITPQVRPG